MSHCYQQMVDGAEHLISCHWLAFLSHLVNYNWFKIQFHLPSAGVNVTSKVLKSVKLLVKMGQIFAGFLWPSENIPNLNSLVLLTLVIGQIDISHLFRVFFFVSYWYNSWNYVLSYFRFLLRSFWMTPHVDKGRWKVHLYPRSFSQFVHLWERWKGQKRLEYLMQLFFIKNRIYIYICIWVIRNVQ